MLYRLHFRSAWDPSQPRGLVVFFHGNNSGTQRDMLTRRYADAERALDLGLAIAFVGSPGANNVADPNAPSSPYFSNYTHIGSGSGTRFWVYEDERLVHELLQSGFNGSIAVDYNRVFFWGGSAGTSFLTRFVERYAGLYGGGFYAWCGGAWGRGINNDRIPPRMSANWAPTFPWTPSGTDGVRGRFRVFVQATTGDHVNPVPARMARYYREVLGLETRADLDGPGGHCRPGTVSSAEVLEWLSAGEDRNPAPAGSPQDIDGDGISNALDDDDDNDGAWDLIDALPLDPRDWRDTDGDGIGDFEDRDADGDGVDNDQDEFSLDAGEWTDTDGDGIGDNLDSDDDNDGVPDATDTQPLEGVRGDQLLFSQWFNSDGRSDPDWPMFPRAFVHPRRPTMFVYPDARGDVQSYQFINLADGDFQLMIDRTERRTSCHSELLPVLCADPPSPLAYFEHHVDRIHVDRNRNGDLTDDGPPLVLARNRGDREILPGVGTVLEVSYASGVRLPYGVRFWTLEDLDIGVRYMGTSVWRGLVIPPTGEPVLVGVVDANVDGLFDSEGRPNPAQVADFSDYACVDTNRNGALEECAGYPFDTGLLFRGSAPRPPPDPPGPADSVRSGELFRLDGRVFRLLVSPSGHEVEIQNP
ncbi:MAG: hypothetical protein F4023_10945 [Acidobacteria bacterium]|nr:hypothetical protein [Acidobacteriota bacterium]MYH49741.1 hypothetical protein [Gammaproteobacteria bacterium]MYK80158.1 hypothetical protein [Acidobacteriota bacterium]